MIYNPHVAKDVFGAKVYRVSAQVGQRALTRDFPFTKKGEADANSHWRKLSAKIIECAPQSSPH